MNDVVYFSVNNWFCGRDYPPTKTFIKWMGNDFNQYLANDEWCKENKLCVYFGNIDMSTNYTVTAPIEFVNKYCPELLTDEEYTYNTVVYNGDERIVEEHKKKYSDFVYHPDSDDENGLDVNDMPFREYSEANFGSSYFETHWWE